MSYNRQTKEYEVDTDKIAVSLRLDTVEQIMLFK